LTAKDVMSSPVLSIDSDKPVFEAAKMMKQKKIGTLMVTLKSKPIGILTEKDVVVRLVAMGNDPKKIKVGQIMTAPLMVATADSDLNEIAKKMADRGVRRVPIVSKGKIVGIITERDILRNEPQLLDAMKEIIEARGETTSESEEPMVGICEDCDTYSENLQLDEGRYLCPECRGG